MSVADELAIRALVARYADAVCRRDPDAWAATWAEDCRWDLGGGRVTSGRAETLDLWRTAIAKYNWVGQVVTSGLVDVEGDQARGWWYLIEFNRRAQGDGTMHLGHYDDDYVRTPDGWRSRPAPCTCFTAVPWTRAWSYRFRRVVSSRHRAPAHPSGG